MNAGIKCYNVLVCCCLSEFMKITAIFYYPLLFYPLLLCNTLQHKLGYVFGTLLSFTHFIILLWQKIDCPRTPEVRRLLAPTLQHLVPAEQIPGCRC